MKRSFFTIIILAVLSLPVSTFASVLIYTGLLTTRTFGHGESKVARRNLVLVVDTEHVDAITLRPNATLFVYLPKSGGGFLPLAIEELDSTFPNFFFSEVAGANGSTVLSLIGNTTTNTSDTLFETFHISGTLTNVILYRDAQNQPVRADVPLALSGGGFARYTDQGQMHVEERSYDFRIHKLTVQFNTGSDGDFDRAVEHINQVLVGMPTSHSTTLRTTTEELP